MSTTGTSSWLGLGLGLADPNPNTLTLTLTLTRHLARPDELMAQRLRALCAAVAAEPPRAPPRAAVGESGASTHAEGCLVGSSERCPVGVQVVAVVGAQHVPGLRALLAAAPTTAPLAAPAGDASEGRGAGVER